MARENHYEFYKQFDAIDRFVKSQNIITEGEAQIYYGRKWRLLCMADCAWCLLKQAFLILANYKCPTEKVTLIDSNGESYSDIIESDPVQNKSVHLPVDFKVVTEYKFEDYSIKKQPVQINENIVTAERLEPGEFKIYGIEKL